MIKEGPSFICVNAFAITKGLYIYDNKIEGGLGLEICHMFADSTVLKQ